MLNSKAFLRIAAFAAALFFSSISNGHAQTSLDGCWNLTDPNGEHATILRLTNVYSTDTVGSIFTASVILNGSEQKIGDVLFHFYSDDDGDRYCDITSPELRVSPQLAFHLSVGVDAESIQEKACNLADLSGATNDSLELHLTFTRPLSKSLVSGTAKDRVPCPSAEKDSR